MHTTELKVCVRFAVIFKYIAFINRENWREVSDGNLSQPSVPANLKKQKSKKKKKIRVSFSSSHISHAVGIYHIVSRHSMNEEIPSILLGASKSPYLFLEATDDTIFAIFLMLLASFMLLACP